MLIDAFVTRENEEIMAREKKNWGERERLTRIQKKIHLPRKAA